MPDAGEQGFDGSNPSGSSRRDLKPTPRSPKLEVRARPLLLALAILMAVSFPVAIAAGASGGRPPSRDASRGASRARLNRGRKSARKAAKARARRRRSELESPRLRAQRLSSRTAFHDIDASAARHLLTTKFGRTLAGISANPAATIADHGRVIHYLNNYSAQVRTPTGVEVETSTAPLRVATGPKRKAPVNLELEAIDGHIEPRTPVTPVVFGGHAEGGVSLTDTDVSLAMVGSNSAATLVGGKEAFYGEVANDVDAVAASRLNGADLSALIRSADSPEVLRYRVGMPLGAKLVAEGDEALVRRDNATVARIPAPWARDAQETEVPTKMTVRGDELLVNVAHRQASYDYPVFVDPELLEQINDSTGIWTYSSGGGEGGESDYIVAEKGSFSHTGPTGVMSLTNGAESLPQEAAGAGGANLLVDKFISQQASFPNPNADINYIDFEGMSSSGEAEPPTYSEFQIEACGRYLNWTASEGSPSNYRFTALDFLHNCNSWAVPGSPLQSSAIRIRVVTGTPQAYAEEWRESPSLIEQVESGPATISITAITVARPLSFAEEEEIGFLEPGRYGHGNPAELSNTDCFAGEPVNCATGNLTETQGDLSIGGIGPGLDATRSYNSQLALTESGPGDFGVGWSGSYESHVEVKEQCISNCEEIVSSSASGALDEEEGEEEPSEGLVAAYSFDEGEGTLAADSVGGHDGTVQNASWAPGKFGPALRFKGVWSERVSVPSSPDLEFTGPFTIDTWIRPVASGEWMPIVFKENGGSESYGLEADDSTPGIPEGFVGSGGEFTEVEASEALPLHSWSYLAVTFDGEDLRLYVDGTLVGTKAAPAPEGGSGVLKIGPNFKGKIDELRLYERALDLEEIQTDESTPIGTTEGSEEPEESEPEEPEGEEPEEGEEEIWEQIAVVHQDNGSTAEFHRLEGETAWMPVNPLVRSELASEGEGFAYTLPDQTVLSFDASGLLEAEKDRNGNTVTVSRDGKGRVSAVSDESGRELVYSYNGQGFVESIEDPAGNVVHYEYEEKNLVSVSQPGSLEPRWQFRYDQNHELVALTDGRGGTTKTKYHSFRVVRQEDPMGRVTLWNYSPEEEGSTTTITEPNESETVEHFNGSGLIASVTRAAGTPSAVTTSFEYDPADELIATTNGEEQTTEFGYGPDGDKVSETDPEGDETSWTYNEAHEVMSETWPSGEETTIVRDAAGNPEAVSRPAPEGKTQSESFEYGPHGELESRTNSLGATWIYGYDGRGDLQSETDPEGDERTWAYDEDSRVTSTVSPRGNEEGAEPSEFTTLIERDPQGRPIKVTDPLGGATEYGYDADGDVESVTDPNGHQTNFTYDADGEQTKVERPDGASEETGYDGAGAVISQTDGDGDTTTYVRNALEQPTGTIDPLKRVTTRTFDGAGDLETLEDPEGRTTTYGYDEADRPTGIDYSSEPGQDVTFGYDEDGDLTSMVDGTGEGTYEYDQLDRLIHSEDGEGETVGWEYDLGDEPVGLTYPNGKAISRKYDEAGRLESVTDWLGHSTTFGYDADSAPTSTTFPVGTGDTDEYTYDRADRIASVEMKMAGEPLASLSYTRDPAGQIESMVSAGLPGAETESFGYDEDERLTKAGADEFGYDPADNLTEGSGTTNTFDEAGQLESATGAGFTYDEEGERTKETPSSGPATTYGYDQAGELTSVQRAEEGEAPAIAESFAYDGTGTMSSRTVGTTMSHLVWDPTEAPEALLSDGENSFIYGPGGMPFEQISTGEVPTYLHHDQLGSTRLLTNAEGKTAATFSYSPYGGLEGHTGTATTPLGYAGQYTDATTGLQYLRARWYDPATGQFMTLDLAVEETREPYAYAYDNPSTFKDPSGLLGIGEIFEEAPGIPCPWCGAAEGATEALEGVASGIGSGVGWVYNQLGTEELDEGEEVPCTSSSDTTPAGRPLSKHYRDETGPERNIPGSVVDETIDHGEVAEELPDRTIYYDPENDVTVVESKTTGKIMSARRGEP